MKKKLITILLCLGMATAMLVGCGSGEEGATDSVDVKFDKKLEESILTRIVAGKSTASDLKSYLAEIACTYETNQYRDNEYPYNCTNTDYFLGHEALFSEFDYIDDTDIISNYLVEVLFKDVDDYKTGITEIREYFESMSTGISGYNDDDGMDSQPIPCYLIADEEDYYIGVMPWIRSYEEVEDGSYYNTVLKFVYYYVSKDAEAGENVEWKDKDGNDYVPKLERKMTALESKWEELAEAGEEPYVSFNYWECELNGNSLTYESEDGYVYTFDITFSKDLTEVKKLELKEKTDKLTETERWNYKIESEIIPAYQSYVYGNIDTDYVFGYHFIYLNDDEIPELIVRGDCEAAGNVICTYINGNVVSMQTQRLGFSYLEKQNLLCNSSGNMGYYYDIVSTIGEAEFSLVAEGSWNEAYDEAGNVRLTDDGSIMFEYSWNEQQVSEEEYANALAQVYDETNAISSYDLSYYNSIWKAYENLRKKSLTSFTTDITNFEMIDGQLSVQLEDGSNWNYPIAEGCVWEIAAPPSYAGEEPQVYGTWTYEELKEHIDGARAEYLQYGEYDSPGTLVIEIEDDIIVRIYTMFS